MAASEHTRSNASARAQGLWKAESGYEEVLILGQITS